MPLAYRFFDTEQQLPYETWYIDGETNFPADGENYYTVRHITVELYTKQKDLEAEAAVERSLRKPKNT